MGRLQGQEVRTQSDVKRAKSKPGAWQSQRRGTRRPGPIQSGPIQLGRGQGKAHGTLARYNQGAAKAPGRAVRARLGQRRCTGPLDDRGGRRAFDSTE